MNKTNGAFWQKLIGQKKREKLILLAAAGLLLLVIAIPAGPTKKASTDEEGSISANSTENAISEVESYEASLEKRLKDVLSTLEGAGETEVMITLRTSEELLTLQNNTIERNTLSESDTAGGSRNTLQEQTENQAVVLKNENGGEETVVIQKIMPKIEGVVVCCEGGDKATVIKEITEAVQALFDVPSHKIKVLKRS